MMKKIIFALLFNLSMSSLLFAESYHFNKCKLTDILYADYSIDLDKRIINVTLEATNGTYQTFSDPIGLIEKDKITTKKIKSGKSADAFFVYYLDVKSKSVIKQNYKIESGIGLIRPVGPTKKSYCEIVKANWDIEKIELAEDEKGKKLTKQLQEEMLRDQNSINECQGNDQDSWTNCVGTKTDKNGFEYIGNFKNFRR